VVKTWTNGWITDSRVGASSTSPCRFGCDPTGPNNTDRQIHDLDCKRLWNNIHLSHKSCTNVQLKHTRFHALCLIPPWEAERPDPAAITHHAICLAAALDVFQTMSNQQKLHSGKCHARKEKSFQEIPNDTIRDHANEAFRRINRHQKIPTSRPTSDQPPSPTTSPSVGADFADSEYEPKVHG
jgi:hypothetical protein